MDSLEKSYCVYKHTNKLNEKVYIGITSQPPETRWKNGYGYVCNEYFYQAIKKYGWNDGFIHEIIASGLTKDEAYMMEIELIEAYDSTNPKKGYNFSTGGECGNAGCSRSEEWIHKMSIALSKPVICIESSIVYDSATEAEKKTGANKGGIGESCRHHSKTAGGMHWCFWDEGWSEFKIACEELGVGYTQCVKCGVLIVKGNTRPKKYCGTCSGRKPTSIRKKIKQKQASKSKSSSKNSINNNKRRKSMGRRKNG